MHITEGIPITKSEEKEWLLAVYSLGIKFKYFPEFQGTKRRFPPKINALKALFRLSRVLLDL